MDRHTGIIIIASIVIVGSLMYSVFNVIALNELELKWNQRGSFDYLTMLNGGIIEVCNASFIPLQFNGLSITTFYQEQEVGRFNVQGSAIQPNSMKELYGEGQTTSLAGQIVSMYLDTEISGTPVMRVDSDFMTVVTSVDTVLLGVIPYAVTDTYAGQEFFEIMNGQTGMYSC